MSVGRIRKARRDDLAVIMKWLRTEHKQTARRSLRRRRRRAGISPAHSSKTRVRRETALAKYLLS